MTSYLSWSIATTKYINDSTVNTHAHTSSVKSSLFSDVTLTYMTVSIICGAECSNLDVQ